MLAQSVSGNHGVVDRSAQLTTVADVIRRFALTSLHPVLQASELLASDSSALDVAVLGQFKSGKSSLLNAVLGESVFPVGVVPVTTVITRAAAGPTRTVQVTYLDGVVEEVAATRLAEFVTEAGNPGNRRKVAVVDLFTPAMIEWPGLRLVDTPGLGSVLAHNTEATRQWMPNVGVALVAVSAERPLADEDRRLVTEARQTAPRVVVVLTKVDLLTEAELTEVAAFLDRALRESFGFAISVLPFSSRVEPARHVAQLREAVLIPITRDVVKECQAALGLKLDTLAKSCRGYLTVGLQAAERADADRERLRAAVLDESVNATVIRDELRLVEKSMCEGTRSSFEQLFKAKQAELTGQMASALAADSRTWQGNLAQHTQRCETWMADWLMAALTHLSQEAVPLTKDLLGQAEGRFRRVVEAFRDRLSRNIHAATGVSVSPAIWEVKQPQVAVVPVAVSRVFMTNWDLLWWLLPMRFVGSLFRRHIQGRVPWEVEKNLTRLTGEWSEKVNSAVTDLRTQAAVWVDAELATLDRLLSRCPTEAIGFREALHMLDQASNPEVA